MGRAQREREAREQLKVVGYRVRRWTALTPVTSRTAADDEEAIKTMRKDRADHLERVAAIIERRMNQMFPLMEPTCKAVSVDKEPQLLFEMTFGATDENDARRRMVYRCERAMSSKVPSGVMGQRVKLSPPWGKSEVEVRDRQARLHAIG